MIPYLVLRPNIGLKNNVFQECPECDTVQPMKILSVIPILKGVAPEMLTYYANGGVHPGALVRVPVRGKSIPAIVTRVDEAASSKTDIKRLAFTLKKIDGVIAQQCFSEVFMGAVARVANYHASSLGPTLSAIVPKIIFENCAELVAQNADTTTSEPKRTTPRLIQASYTDRVARYRSFIRESFAQQKSIVVVAPTTVEAETLFDELSHGIAERAFLIVPSLSKKKLLTVWQKALDVDTPVVIVGTPASLALSRRDIGTFIIEHESSPHYKSQTRPFVDARITVHELAASLGAVVIVGDIFARLETSTAAIEAGDESIRPSFRQDRTKPVALIDMSTTKDNEGQQRSQEKKKVMSNEALAALTRSMALGRLSFVYSLRKGHSGFTVCRDCGTVLICDRCAAPMVLHLPKPKNKGEVGERLFECHRCGRVRNTHTVCDDCSSWRLETYGLGVEKVAETLRDELPDAQIFTMSADTVTTPAQAREMISQWKASGNGILVGTDMTLAYLRGASVDAIVVASVDTLLALPDIGMPERVFRLVSELADTAESLVIQTRNPDAAVFSFAVSGDGWEFYQQEIGKRKILSYPPYTTLIKVTRRGEETAVMRDLGMIHEMSLPYQTIVYPAFISHVNGLYNAHALISVQQGNWPDERLVTQLRGLPPAFVVDVAPGSVL